MATALATNVATLNAYVIDQRCYMFTTKIKESIFLGGGDWDCVKIAFQEVGT